MPYECDPYKCVDYHYQNETTWRKAMLLMLRRLISSGGSGDNLVWRDIDLDETGDLIKGSAGNVSGLWAFNAGDETLYIKLYDRRNAPDVGTTVPIATFPLLVGHTLDISQAGISFTNGIGIAATTALVDTDTGAPAANACQVNVFYK